MSSAAIPSSQAISAADRGTKKSEKVDEEGNVIEDSPQSGGSYGDLVASDEKNDAVDASTTVNKNNNDNIFSGLINTIVSTANNIALSAKLAAEDGAHAISEGTNLLTEIVVSTVPI